MLTTKGEEEDKLRGFESEVDDYIKPFSINELLIELKRYLRE